jgi:hypothetical protein
MPVPCKKKASPEYYCWFHMVSRCTDPRHPVFEKYGGRGIGVCERWLASFSDFLADMGARPGKGFSIDRKDNAKGYTPDNCRWADKKTQSRNQTSNHLIQYGGRTVTIAEAGELSGLNPNTISQRILAGWSVERATTEPAGASVQPERKYQYRGQMLSLAEVAEMAGLTGPAVLYRLSRGMTVEEAIATPKLKRGRPRKAVPNAGA